MSDFDVVVNGGLWFDGTGSAPRRRNLGIRDGVVVRASIRPLPVGPDTEIIDAAGKWVVPGFVDVHTHYDAEVLVSPGLPESVRHGVTTVVLGNCSLSTVYSTPRECADLFSRVEAVPHDSVLRILDENKIWQSPAEYVEALESLPLGPNVAGFIGHSDIRTHVLGLGRGTDKRTKPSARELERMGAMLTEAVDAGFLGLSSMTNALDKIDGDEYRSRSLPSTYARWKEFRFLNRILRERGKILQSAPTINLHPNIAGFFAESSGLGRRKPLKTSLLSAADSKAYPPIVYFMLAAAPLLNRFAKTDFKWQHLPVPFTVYADGIDLVVFEEFGAGAAALHLKDEVERNALLQDESYRRRFRKDYDNKFSPRIWHRNFYDAVIVGCPDEALIGKTFGAVGDLRGVHPVDAYLDLVVQYGTDLRWRTTIANHRPEVREEARGQLRRADGIRRRGCAPAQHGVLQLSDPVAEEGQGRAIRPQAVPVRRACRPPADGRTGRLVRHRRRPPARRGPRRPRRHRSGGSRRDRGRIVRGRGPRVRRSAPDGQPQRRRGGRDGDQRQARLPRRGVHRRVRRHQDGTVPPRRCVGRRPQRA